MRYWNVRRSCHVNIAMLAETNFSPAENPRIPGQHITPWNFDAHAGLDRSFHALISRFGSEVTMALDEIVMDPPVQAAMRATKVFQHYHAQAGNENATTGTRDLMAALAGALKPSAHLLDEQALVPPEAVFRGFGGRKPRGG